jgi:5-methylthioadenosine/S-adenosylhomocysteine deaminase
VTSKILLSGGCVLTLGARTPNFNFTQADVLMDEGLVAEVGAGIRARDAEQVDVTDTIVMPGFVDNRHPPQVRTIGSSGIGHDRCSY